jgi:hypothetical protein
MSLCNLGRPPQDAGLQNLVVNDTLRVNKLLKASKAEVDRLCADIATTVAQTAPTVFEGSFTGTSLNEFENYLTFAFPVGSNFRADSTYAPTLLTIIWTDESLVIDDFRAFATGEGPGPLPTPINFTISVVAAPTITALQLGAASPPNGTEIITIPFTGLSSTSVSEISTAVPATVPAGSYVSIRLNGTGVITNVSVSWSIRLKKA